LNQVLAGALNERNRKNKAEKFCFFTSEDAVTWTLFRGLQVEHALPLLLNAIVPGFALPVDVNPDVLLWGCPVPPETKRGGALRANLIAASDAVHERRRYRTEPDVVIDAGNAGIIFIEVKLHSGNEVRAYANAFRRYLKDGAFADPDAATESGYYELVRNWSLGAAVAGNRPFHLVNLGPDKIFDDAKQVDRWAAFTCCIDNGANRSFSQIRWSKVLSVLCDPSIEWLHDFVSQRLNW